VQTRLIRLARIVALAVIFAITITNVIWALQDWHLHDMNVYWTAGEMWRTTGKSLHARAADQRQLGVPLRPVVRGAVGAAQ